jgi:hypothetical protein
VEEKINPCSHTLCGHVENASGYPHGSMDAKVTNRSMVERMEIWARFGHSCGQPFIVADHVREHPEYAFDDLIDIIPRPYASFSAFSRMEVNVVNEDGGPVPNAIVNITSNIDGSTFELPVDGGGKALFEMLPRSEYTIRAESGNRDGYIVWNQKEDSSLEVVLGSSPDSITLGRSTMVVGLLIVIIGLVAAAVFIAIRRRGTKLKYS